VYDLVISGSQVGCPGSVTAFCDPQPVNCSGLSTTLSGSFAGSVLTLDTSAGPPSEFGYYLSSFGMNAGTPISAGNFCLGSPSFGFERFNVGSLGSSFNALGVFDAQGDFVVSGTSADFQVPVTMPSGVPYAGTTAYFQMWHRNSCPAGDSNFSNGIGVNF